MDLNNVKVKNPIYAVSGKDEKIRIDLDAIVRSAVFDKKECDFTPAGILNFCRTFKEANENKGQREEYFRNAPDHTLGLHEVFEKQAPKSYEYAVLAHILLAQGRIRSKVVSATDKGGESEHAFVVYFQNGKMMILDAALQKEIIEPDENGVYKHYSEKRGKDMLYTKNIRSCKPVSPLEDVPDYNPKKV